jgi:hypothetical protein
MLIGALITLLFLSVADLPGQAFVDNIRSFAKQNISERDRKKEILSLVDDMEDALEDFSEQLKDSGKSMVKLNRDRSSTRQGFKEVLDDLNESRMSTQEKILDLRFKMKDRMTREEWQTAFKE